MNRFSALLVCGAFAGSITACGSSNPTTPMDAGGTTDNGGGGGDGGGGGGDGGGGRDGGGGGGDGGSCGVTPGAAGIMMGCYTENGCAPACPAGHVMNSATQPNFRVTRIEITQPPTLAVNIVNNAINGFLAARTFLWGVSFDFTASTFRTGPFDPTHITAGTRGHMDETYTYFRGNAPAAGGAATRWDPSPGTAMLMGNTASSSTLMATVRLPIIDPTMGNAVVTELPLDNARMHDVQLAADRGCVGVARFSSNFYNECSAVAWYTSDPNSTATPPTPYGVIEADISVAASQMIHVSAFPGNPTLCQVLAGIASRTDCTQPPAMWPATAQRPTTMVNGMPAFHLVANISAIAANVAP